VNFIDANKEKPFFLVSLVQCRAFAASWPRRSGWRSSSISDKRQQGYAALIGEADEAIGTGDDETA